MSYAASICWEMIPELKNLKKMFEDRFGKDFVVADNVQEEVNVFLFFCFHLIYDSAFLNIKIIYFR